MRCHEDTRKTVMRRREDKQEAGERGENWLGYYWSPTSMIGKYKMHKFEKKEINLE